MQQPEESTDEHKGEGVTGDLQTRGAKHNGVPSFHYVTGCGGRWGWRFRIGRFSKRHFLPGSQKKKTKLKHKGLG